jgi:hypothetical protein
VEFSQVLEAPTAEVRAALEQLPDWVSWHARRHRSRSLSL